MKLTIGDKVYDFEFRVSSLCEMERETDMTVSEVLTLPDYTMYTRMLWTGLLKHHGVTMEEAGEMVETLLKEHGHKGLGKIISDAIEEAGFMTAQGKAKPKTGKR